jgi:hypothetical protein
MTDIVMSPAAILPGKPPSRAMNIDAGRSDVIAMCAKHKAEISAIEDLISGGTRVVLINIQGANLVRKAFGKRVMAGEVVRARWVRNSQ